MGSELLPRPEGGKEGRKGGRAVDIYILYVKLVEMMPGVTVSAVIKRFFLILITRDPFFIYFLKQFFSRSKFKSLFLTNPSLTLLMFTSSPIKMTPHQN